MPTLERQEARASSVNNNTLREPRKMSDSPRKASGTLGGLIWLAIALFALFFLNVVMQRFFPGMYDIAPALEAALLLIATGCFISGCLRLESRQSSTP